MSSGSLECSLPPSIHLAPGVKLFLQVASLHLPCVLAHELQGVDKHRCVRQAKRKGEDTTGAIPSSHKEGVHLWRPRK